MGLRDKLTDAEIERLALVALVAHQFGHDLLSVYGSLAEGLYLIREGLEKGNLNAVIDIAKSAEKMSMFAGVISAGIEGFCRSGGKTDYRPRPYNPNDEIERLIETGIPNFSQIELSKRFNNKLEIALHYGLFLMCLYGISENSRKAQATKVEYSTVSDGGMVKVSVTDNGDGIKPEHLEEMLEALEEPVISFVKGTTGLGLATTAQIMKLCGGKLEIESRHGTEDHGTTVKLYIPAAKEKD